MQVFNHNVSSDDHKQFHSLIFPRVKSSHKIHCFEDNAMASAQKHSDLILISQVITPINDFLWFGGSSFQILCLCSADHPGPWSYRAASTTERHQNLWHSNQPTSSRQGRRSKFSTCGRVTLRSNQVCKLSSVINVHNVCWFCVFWWYQLFTILAGASAPGWTVVSCQTFALLTFFPSRKVQWSGSTASQAKWKSERNQWLQPHHFSWFSYLAGLYCVETSSVPITTMCSKSVHCHPKLWSMNCTCLQFRNLQKTCWRCECWTHIKKPTWWLQHKQHNFKNPPSSFCHS